MKCSNRTYARAHYEANREKCRAKSRAYHEANREKCRAKSRAYREANLEERRAKERAYYRLSAAREEMRDVLMAMPQIEQMILKEGA
ncbi:hypothetical protein [Celeribacter halophilus]|uniref:hypothetical protein n=1 Tax=Celeribacter halophilus TaxID=576117 RepID=UPI00083618D6|nr:hypothetical protein [Celeribacter halophilus]